MKFLNFRHSFAAEAILPFREESGPGTLDPGIYIEIRIICKSKYLQFDAYHSKYNTRLRYKDSRC